MTCPTLANLMARPDPEPLLRALIASRRMGRGGSKDHRTVTSHGIEGRGATWAEACHQWAAGAQHITRGPEADQPTQPGEIVNVVSRPRNGLSLCAGGGGLDLGLMLAEPDFHTRCFVEWEEYPRSVLIAAQRAGYFAPAPIWDDVTTFDGRPFRGAIDTILAGYPCQPFSAAGQRRGADDERHLWPDVARIIGEIAPEWVFLENVAGHVSLGLETVLRDLWDMGWTPAAGIFSASETGAPHERQRVFIVAHRSCERRQQDARGSSRDEETDGRARRIEREPDCHNQPQRACSAMDAGHVEDAGRSERRPFYAQGDDADGAQAGRQQGAGWSGEPSETLAHANTHANAGRMERGSSYGGPGEGQAVSKQRERLRAGARSGGGYLFPPGPGDAAAWSAVLRSSPDMAPSAAARDLHTWARNMEADGRKWWEAEVEPEFCRFVDGLADRTPKLRLLGNGVFPLAAGHAWRTLSAAHGLCGVDLDAAAGNPAAAADEPLVRAAE